MRNSLTILLVVFIIFIREASPENTSGTSNSLLTINFASILPGSYDEMIEREGFAFDEERVILDIKRREYDVRFAHGVGTIVDLGSTLHLRKYENHTESTTISSFEIDDATTQLFGVTGFVQIRSHKTRYQPYISAGGGYGHISIKDDIASRFRSPPFTSRVVFEEDLDRFIYHIEGGIRFLVGEHWLIGSNLSYLAAPSKLHSFNWGISTGIAWQ